MPGKRLWFMPLACVLAAGSSAETPKEDSRPVEIRVLDREGRLLLSRGDQPLAVAQVRAAATPTIPVFSIEQVRAALKPGSDTPKALSTESEQIRALSFALAGKPGAALSVTVRARKAGAGARVLVSGLLEGLPGSAAPGEDPQSAPPALELALQLFPDSAGKTPALTYADSQREPARNDPPSEQERVLRSFVLEGAGGFRVNFGRSAPARFVIRRALDGLLLTAPLCADPRRPANIGSFIFYLGAAPDAAPPEVSPLTLDKPQTAAREIIEGFARVYASGADPFSLSEVAVVAEIAMPAKDDKDPEIKRLPCFFWEPVGGASVEGEFRFRFAPPVEGLYAVRMVVVTPAGQSRGDAEAFLAGPPASPGFVRARTGERQMRFDDGRLFVPSGCELPPEAATPDVLRQRFTTLTRARANTATLRFPLETARAGWIDPDRATALDDILRAAQVRDLHLIYAIEDGEAIGAGSTTHPYFREMGGVLAATPEFFRNPAVKKLFQNRMTYLAARYGAFRSVLAWDLLRRAEQCWEPLKNYPDDPQLAPGDADLCRRARRDVQEWADEMALYLKGMDQHQHLICASTSVNPDRPWADLENLENLDFTFVCPRLPDANSARGNRYRDECGVLSQWAKSAREPGRPHRPYLLGPLCVEKPAADGKAATSAQLARLRHNSAFCALSAGMAGAPLADIAEFSSRDRSGAQLSAQTAAFADALNEAAQASGKEYLRYLEQTLETTGKQAIRLQGRWGKRGGVIWLQDKRFSWLAEDENPGSADPLDILLPPLAEGAYRATWTDSKSGQVIKQESCAVTPLKIGQAPEPARLRAPAFTADVLLVVSRQ
jgi:hypothetical protein